MSGIIGAISAGQAVVVTVDREIPIHDYDANVECRLEKGTHTLKREQTGVGHEPDEFMLFLVGTKRGMPEVVWKHHPSVRFVS